MKLREYVFGYADADTEFANNPELFKKAFYDPNDYISEVIDGFKFMIVGRKGIGKTAYASKLRQLSEDGEKMIDNVYIHLNEIDFSLFKKMADNKYEGTQKYQKIWDWVIGLEILKYLVENHFELNEKLDIIVKILENNEIYISDNLPTSIRKASKKYAKFSFKGVEAGVEGHSENTTLDIYEFVEKIFEALKDVYINKKLFIIFDGLDDLLRCKVEKADMIAGLIRSANYTNIFLSKNKVRCKVLLLIRNDILSSVIDPDINKIKRDSSIYLSWNEDNIKELVSLRIKNSSNNLATWYTIFPKELNKHDSLDFILDFTLLRPRDILQFLNQAKEMYPTREKLTYQETHSVLKQYSSIYFIGEIKDELSGFVEDEVIHSLLGIFQKIGETDFTFQDFKNIMHDVIKNDDDSHCWEILQRLIQTSAIGQISNHDYYDKRVKRMTKKSVMKFFYKNPQMIVQRNNKFHIHRALYKALNFSIN